MEIVIISSDIPSIVVELIEGCIVSMNVECKTTVHEDLYLAVQYMNNHPDVNIVIFDYDIYNIIISDFLRKLKSTFPKINLILLTWNPELVSPDFNDYPIIDKKSSAFNHTLLHYVEEELKGE